MPKVKHPTAKDDWVSWADVARRESLVLTLCPYSRDFTEFEFQRIPYSSHTSYLQRRNFAHFLR